MNVLVTGGAGFIGSNFISFWLEKYPQDKIINLDKLTYAGNLSSLREAQKNKNYKFVKGDICEANLIDKLTKDIDLIVHFAAESHVDRSILGPQVFVQTNVIGTQVLLDAALRNKVKRFHYVSTDEVFGALPDKGEEKFCEDWPFRPNSPYAASKAAADCLVRAYCQTFGLPVSVTNCSNNYGPYQFPEKLIPLAITNLMEEKKVPVYGDGMQVRDWLYVKDHCQAIDLIVHDSDSVGETYCIGGLNKDIPNLEVIKKILKIMEAKESEIEYVKDRPGHDRRYSVDWIKVSKKLGWRPENDFDTWLEKTVKWYRNNTNWWKPLKEKQKEYFKKQYSSEEKKKIKNCRF
ncbi:dTDP-glucose 4,6-dehydratase [Candidatus Microgenomates bacterium]|jgi:dTDP-glucose 4,6-dehydratase|nr:MAG: dTDP-glucose 4,6-dehydratase [Candidatus Microgenomates bacterium]